MSGSVSYQELLDRYGAELAHDLLVTIEKSAKINSHDFHMDEEARLQRAFSALEKVLAA